jgi:hypothetical protein
MYGASKDYYLKLVITSLTIAVSEINVIWFLGLKDEREEFNWAKESVRFDREIDVLEINSIFKSDLAIR